jgi:ABC-type enterochelin transport system permease subunit
MMRLVARWATFKKFWFDDAFVIFAWMLALGTAIDWQLVAWKMYEFVSVTSGQIRSPSPDFVADTESYYKGSLAVLVFYYSSLWAVKISFLLFFKRLGQNVRGQKVLWWSIFGLTLATYLVCIGDIQYSCLVVPLPKLVATCSSDQNVQFQTATLKLNCALDVVTDFLSSLALFPWKQPIAENVY